MIQSLENFIDARADRQTHKSDFIGRCPANVERRKSFYISVSSIIYCDANLNYNLLEIPCILVIHYIKVKRKIIA